MRWLISLFCEPWYDPYCDENPFKNESMGFHTIQLSNRTIEPGFYIDAQQNILVPRSFY